MHELWLCKNILDIINQKMVEKNCVRVKKVYLEIGQLAAVEKSALIFSFNVLTQGTAVENADLEIIDIPGKAVCETCGKNFSISQYYDACQECGGFSLTVIQGEELRVKSMEVE